MALVMRLLVFAAAVPFLAAGCRTGQSLPRDWDILVSDPRGREVISKQVLVFADNQVHNLYSGPISWWRTAFAANHITPHAIRPVQLDFYGDALLKHMLEFRGAQFPVIHLGDACDLSCTVEFAAHRELMRAAKRGWVMAPGNHDGFFYGNEHRPADDPVWTMASRGPGTDVSNDKPLTKDRFIRMYLAALALQRVAHDASFASLAAHLGVAGDAPDDLYATAERMPVSGSWRRPPETHGLLAAAEWVIDQERPWRSFIIQEVDIGLTAPGPAGAEPIQPIRCLLLDTCHYSTAPSLLGALGIGVNAGVSGEIGCDQFEIARRWIAAARPDTLWVFMGHHPADALRSGSRAALEDARRKAGARILMSAHTHKGSFLAHGSGPDAWLEVNVGSLTDWPSEWRTLMFFKVDGRPALYSRRHTAEDVLPQLGAPWQWEAKPGDDDYYLTYAEMHTISGRTTEGALMKTLLGAHLRALETFKLPEGRPPPDAAPLPGGLPDEMAVKAEIRRLIKQGGEGEGVLDFVRALHRYEAVRKPADPKTYRNYRLAQAIWAGKYMAIRMRRPEPSDWMILLPPMQPRPAVPMP